MIAVAVLAGLVIAGLLVHSYLERKALLDAQAEQARRFDSERQTLLERIQRPERTPASLAAPQLELPEVEPDDAHLVNTIHFDENYVGEEE